MSNIYGFIVSTLFVLLILAISLIAQKKTLFSEETTRKFVHIGVSNYWFIAMHFFTSNLWASVVPIIFIIVNSFSYRYSLISSMERTEKNSAGLGTVYYPISLTILALVSFSSYSQPYVGALGILTMGYGDGLAAVIGSKYGKLNLPFICGKKTILGTLTMFVVTFMVISGILSVYRPEQSLLIALFLACIGTILELFTPNGLDNLTLPIGISFIYQWLFY